MSLPPYVLLCTVGTSLQGHLEKLRCKKLADFSPEDMKQAAQDIGRLDPRDRVCGAEINSIQALIDEGHVVERPQVYLFYSDTAEGKIVARILSDCLPHGFHGMLPPLRSIKIEGLSDSNPKGFRTKGLRNLVRQLCACLRQYQPSACAINATGGYKAQIAIAVMIGQALEVPVFYKHEHFRKPSIIRFPPLPITLDEKVWHDNLGLFQDAYEADDYVPVAKYEEEMGEVLESLIERDTQEGREYFILSPAGMILHEKCKDSLAVQSTPPPPRAKKQKAPRWSKDHCADKQREIKNFMQKVTDGNEFVEQCRGFYCHPDLPSVTGFRLSQGNVVGIYSDGSFTAKFKIRTTAKGASQKLQAVNLLQRWLQDAL